LIPLASRGGLSPRAELLARLLLPALALALVARYLPKLRIEHPWTSTLLGVGVCVVWVAPDLLIPGWRAHWIFQNGLTGRLQVSMPGSSLSNPVDLMLRSLRACTVVALAEELFWRGWILRWLIRDDFEKVPLGAWSLHAFLLTAGLFAIEHGPYWDVGLVAGLLYNWWMVRTKSLGDLVLAHGMTNAALAAFVILTRRWEFWM
jgi:hypothetical protein